MHLYTAPIVYIIIVYELYARVRLVSSYHYIPLYILGYTGEQVPGAAARGARAVRAAEGARQHAGM
jgi:hypothetical protein